MKILQVHNFYQQPGGEDQVLAAEYELLTSRGHTVCQYLLHNDAIKNMSAPSIAVRTTWNRNSYAEIENLIDAEQPDVVHAHNTFPLVSPAVYYAAAAKGVPVVQTLHNYRLLCPAATLFRNGQVCEECVGSAVPYKSVLYGCYRASRAATAGTASMLVAHRLARTWTRKVQAYIALTNFAKAKFVEGGLPASKITVKPNCVTDDPGVGDGSGGYVLFVGRLAEEKGLRTLLTAWEQLCPDIPLKIAGDGPLSEWLRERVASNPNVHWLGHANRSAVMKLLQNAALLVFPSEYYENLPMVIIEAFACGTPVLASRLGSMQELVQEGVNGFHFPPWNPTRLAEQVRAMLSDAPRLRAMRERARSSYVENYSGARNYSLLMELYNSVILTYKRVSTAAL